MDMPVDSLQLKDPLVLFESGGPSPDPVGREKNVACSSTYRFLKGFDIIQKLLNDIKTIWMNDCLLKGTSAHNGHLVP